MTELSVYPVALTGGLQDSKAQPEPGDLQTLTNFGIFRGRFALRAPLLAVVDLGDTVTHILALAYHDLKCYVVAWNNSTEVVSLWQMDTNGDNATNKGNLWTGVTTAPRPILASIEGGIATAGVSRLYISDYDQIQVTRIYDSDGDSISTLQADLDDDGGQEDVTFSYVYPFQYHLWGSGYLEASVSRPEMLRFSRPGLIPEEEPAYNVVNGYLAEWWTTDRRSVGSRGEKITCLAGAKGSMIVFKKDETHALFGYDADSWAITSLSETIGAVGPYAAHASGDGWCFAWSETGPIATNGQVLDDKISEDVRKHVLEAAISDKVIVRPSPDDKLVYFIYPHSNATYPDHYLAFNKYAWLASGGQKRIWSEGAWSAYDGGTLLTSHAALIPAVTLPEPAAAPSNLVAVTNATSLGAFFQTIPGSDDPSDQVGLSWTNGDTALETETQIWGRTSPASSDTLIATVGSGVASYVDTDRDSITTYYYDVRHVRSGNYSSFAGEASAKTVLDAVTDFVATRSATGILLSMTNNEDSADLLIYRKESTEGGWGLFTTLSSQATGTITHDDTTGDGGTSYDYRVLVRKAGETDSAYSDTVTAIAGGGVPSITSASHTVNLGECTLGYQETYVTVGWDTSNIESEDRVKISRSIDGGSYVTRESSYDISIGSYRDLWYVYDNGGSSTQTLRYKLEVLDGGTTVVNTSYTTQSTENASDCEVF